MVEDVQKTVGFYQEILPFEFGMGVPMDNEVIMENDREKTLRYALVKYENIEIMFQAKESLSEDVPYFAGKEIGASISLYFEIEDVDSFYTKIKDKVETVKDIHTTWYGMREWYITDCNGYVLGFAGKQD